MKDNPENVEKDNWLDQKRGYLKAKNEATPHLLPEARLSQGFGSFLSRLARAGLESFCYTAGTIGQEFDQMKPMGVDLTEPSLMLLYMAESIERQRQMDRLARHYPYLYSWMKRKEKDEGIGKQLGSQVKSTGTYNGLLNIKNDNQKALRALEPIAYEELTKLRIGRGYSLLALPTDNIGQESLAIRIGAKIDYILAVMAQMKVIPSFERLVSSFGLTHDAVTRILEEYENHNPKTGNFYLQDAIRRWGQLREGGPTISPDRLVLYPPERRINS
ncbi:hypothetical protein KA531_01135 [Candidatus Saccharibacteria bacterium]|nr:hypothetical protein [Candidatus Saccharibacteria bacterium]